MRQHKTAAEKTLGVLLCSEHCLGSVLDGVVKQDIHEWGYCVTCVTMLSTVWWWTRTHMNVVTAWPLLSWSTLSCSLITIQL